MVRLDAGFRDPIKKRLDGNPAFDIGPRLGSHEPSTENNEQVAEKTVL
jgi:hypothetical protein